MGAPSLKQSTREIGAPSTQVTREMDAASNQSKAVREAPWKQVNSLNDDQMSAPNPDYAHLLSTWSSDNSQQ